MPNFITRLSPSFAHSTQDACDCLVVGVWFEGDKIHVTGKLPAPLIKQIDSLAEDGDLSANLGSLLTIQNPGSLKAARLLLVNLGQPIGQPKNTKKSFNPRNYILACQAVATHLASLSIKKVNCTLVLAKVNGFAVDWCAKQWFVQVARARYHFNDFSSTASEKFPALSLGLCLGAPTKTNSQSIKTAVKHAEAIAIGETTCRDLANTPPNVCTPEYMAQKARGMVKKFKSLKITILDEKKMKLERMNALLAVGLSSIHKPRMVIMHYTPPNRRTRDPIVLVGKGISFDTGGISLKPSLAMDEMKFDMCGAASVLGTMHAIAHLKLDRPVIGVMVCAENMPDAQATRPGDVVKSRAGHTIEILNTDAEGRLVLCDALDYIKKFKPKTVVDIATLTGACVVALGKVVSGLMSNDQELANKLFRASEVAYDRVWQLPLAEDYREMLRSPVADLANIGGAGAGTITAACFLEKFCRDYRWAHLDIAGTAWLSAPQRSATGRPVPLLCQYLIDEKD